MKIKKSTTPKSQIRSLLRKLWLRSRERSFALKRDKYTCQICNRKKSKSFKVSVHHMNNINNWNEIIDKIYDQLLCDTNNLITVCNECHKKKHGK